MTACAFANFDCRHYTVSDVSSYLCSGLNGLFQTTIEVSAVLREFANYI